jgi:hypothetical protein
LLGALVSVLLELDEAPPELPPPALELPPPPPELPPPALELPPPPPELLAAPPELPPPALEPPPPPQPKQSVVVKLIIAARQAVFIWMHLAKQ